MDPIDDVVDRVMKLQVQMSSGSLPLYGDSTPSVQHALLSAPLFYSSSAEDYQRPLPRESAIVDPQRHPGQFVVLPDSDLDAPRDVLNAAMQATNIDIRMTVDGRTQQGRSSRGVKKMQTQSSKQGDLAIFEETEAKLFATEGSQQQQGLQDSDNDGDDDTLDNEVVGAVASRLSQLGDEIRTRIDKTRSGLRTAAASVPTAPNHVEGGVGVNGGCIRKAQNRYITVSTAQSMELEATHLLSFSLSNPTMRAYAQQVTQQHRVSTTLHAQQVNLATGAMHQNTVSNDKKEQPTAGEKISVLSQPSAAATAAASGGTNVLSTSAVSQATNISRELAAQIAQQQQTLKHMMEEQAKIYEKHLEEQRQDSHRTTTEAYSKSEALIRQELGSIKRQQHDVVRTLVQEELIRGGGGRVLANSNKQADPSMIVVSTGTTAAAAATSASTNGGVPLAEQTATLVANALQVERKRMEEERKQWQQTLERQTWESKRNQEQLQKELERLSKQHQETTAQSTEQAIQQSARVYERQATKLEKIIVSQQKQQLTAIREVQRQSPSSVTPVGGAASSSTTAATAVATTAFGLHGQDNHHTSRQQQATRKKSDAPPPPSHILAAEIYKSAQRRVALRRNQQEQKQNPQSAAMSAEGTQSAPVPLTIEHAVQSTVCVVDEGTSPTHEHPPAPPVANDSTLAHDEEAADIRSRVEQATMELRHAGVMVGETPMQQGASRLPAPPSIVVLAESGQRSDNGALKEHGEEGEERSSVQCVEMCVASFLSQKRAEAVSATQNTRRDRAANEDSSFLTKEEALMLVDARKRLERIRQFSFDGVAPEDPNCIVHCAIGESAETLLLTAVTSGLIHDAIAEKMRNEVNAAQQQEAQEDSNPPAAVTSATLLPLTGDANVDRMLAEQCLQEFINIHQRPPSTKNESSSAGGILRGDDRTQQQANRTALEAALTHALMQEMARQTSTQPHPPSELEHATVAVPSTATPDWLQDPVVPVPSSVLSHKDAAASGAPSAPLTAYAALPPPVIHVSVDTTAISEVVKQLLNEQRDRSEPHRGGEGNHAIAPASMIMSEAQRSRDVDEELRIEVAPHPQIAGPQQIVPDSSGQQRPASSSSTRGLSLDDMEAVLADRVMRRLHPLLSRMANPTTGGLDMSGVSSSTSGSSSSSSADESTITAQPPQLQLTPELFFKLQQLQSEEALRRNRFYGDVDHVFGLVYRGIMEERAKVPQRPVGIAPPAAAASAVAAAPAMLVPQPLPLPRDPAAAFIVDWFRNLERGGPDGLPKPAVLEVPVPAPKPLEVAAPPVTTVPANAPPTATMAPVHPLQQEDIRLTQKIAAQTSAALRIDEWSASDTISSTHPSSYDPSGMHRFVQYLPEHFVSDMYPRKRLPGYQDTSTATTQTTLFSESATSVTSTTNSSGKKRGLLRPMDDATSSGSSTTVSSLDSDDIRRLRAEQKMREAQWPTTQQPLQPSGNR